MFPTLHTLLESAAPLNRQATINGLSLVVDSLFNENIEDDAIDAALDANERYIGSFDPGYAGGTAEVEIWEEGTKGVATLTITFTSEQMNEYALDGNVEEFIKAYEGQIKDDVYSTPFVFMGSEQIGPSDEGAVQFTIRAEYKVPSRAPVGSTSSYNHADYLRKRESDRLRRSAGQANFGGHDSNYRNIF